MIGPSNAGKTALVYRYVLDELPPGLTSTIGVEFTKKTIKDALSNQKFQLHIWDTAGQEKYKSVTKHYYRGADACLLIYDMSSRKSFEEIPKWLEEVKENVPEDCIICLLANKGDLEITGHRVISREEGQRFSNKNNLAYQETSAFWVKDTNLSQDSIQGGIEKIYEVIIGKITSKHLKDSKSTVPPSDKLTTDLKKLCSPKTKRVCKC